MLKGHGAGCREVQAMIARARGHMTAAQVAKLLHVTVRQVYAVWEKKGRNPDDELVDTPFGRMTVKQALEAYEEERWNGGGENE